MKREGNGDGNWDYALKTVPQKLGKETKKIGNQSTNRKNPDNSVVKIGSNTEM